MKVVVNTSGQIIKAISNSSIPQVMSEGEFEIEVKDSDVVDAIMKGLNVSYDSNSSSFVIPEYQVPPTEIEQLASYVLDVDFRVVMLEMGM